MRDRYPTEASQLRAHISSVWAGTYTNEQMANIEKMSRVRTNLRLVEYGAPFGIQPYSKKRCECLPFPLSQTLRVRPRGQGVQVDDGED